MIEGEADIGFAHAAQAACRDRLALRLVQHREALRGERGEQRFAVRKMARWRVVRYPDATRHCAHRQARKPLFLQDIPCRPQDAVPQGPVVVAAP